MRSEFYGYPAAVYQLNIRCIAHLYALFFMRNSKPGIFIGLHYQIQMAENIFSGALLLLKKQSLSRLFTVWNLQNA